MLSTAIKELAQQVGEQLIVKSLVITAAESCTGGGLAYAMTSIPGSSVWFKQGIVSYSDETKKTLLQVPHETLTQYGAVSEQTASAMAYGALANSNADLAIAITGIAGPGGGSLLKPVGTVWIASALRAGQIKTVCHHFVGDREKIRQEAITHALLLILESIRYG